jgi:hypothetical protein
MKERPILFSAPMVRAILAGRKTQTRRVAKTVTSLPDGKGYTCLQKPGSNTVLPLVEGQWQWQPAAGDAWRPYPRMEEYCPYGKTGDRLWVRETWAPMIGGGYVYAADYTPERLKEKDGHGFWKPPIFCKREASRITLEIVAVRVERLRDITGQDAIAEGIQPYVTQTATCTITSYHDYLTGKHDRAARNSYETLWRSINGPDSWDANPWVWVIEFQTL